VNAGPSDPNSGFPYGRRVVTTTTDVTLSERQASAKLIAAMRNALPALLAAAKREAALRAALTFAHQLMPDVSQLLDGWHADGTAWTEWDAGVRSAVSELQRRLESLLGRAALSGGATGRDHANDSEDV
jgi:hypothetical protein